MKIIATIIALTTAILLTGCETTDSEGNVTRFDSKVAVDVINAGYQTYDRYQRAQQPGYYQQPYVAPVYS